MSAQPLVNWADNITYSTGVLHRPGTVTELQELVPTLPRLRALGTRHSFSRVADTTGDLVTVADLEPVLEIDAEGSTVLVSAGTRYAVVGDHLHRNGWALPNLGSLPNISVAGACATGTHGSGVGNSCLASSVVEIEYVRPDGELVRIAAGDERFPGAVLSLGSLGIVTSLRLAVRPTYELRQRVWLEASLPAVLADLAGVLATGYSVSLFSLLRGPVDEQVVDQVWVKSEAGLPEPDLSRWGARPATAPMHPIAGEDPDACTRQLGEPGPWHTRLPHFRAEFTPSAGDEQQTEYLLAASDAADALAAVAALDLEAALMVCEVRAIAADDLWLSPFHGRQTVALHFTWVNDDVLVADAVSRVERALTPYAPRPHWGKVFSLPAETVRAEYPHRARLAELAAAHDPERRLGNEYLERYLY